MTVTSSWFASIEYVIGMLRVTNLQLLDSVLRSWL